MTTKRTSERTFLKLKLIKDRLRASMSQYRLNSLSLMSIESDLLRKISYSDIINDFAEQNHAKYYYKKRIHFIKYTKIMYLFC